MKSRMVGNTTGNAGGDNINERLPREKSYQVFFVICPNTLSPPFRLLKKYHKKAGG